MKNHIFHSNEFVIIVVSNIINVIYYYILYIIIIVIINIFDGNKYMYSKFHDSIVTLW